MVSKAGQLWVLLLVPVGILALLYLYFTLFPGSVPLEAFKYFSPAEIAQGRHYQQVMRLVFLGAFLAKVAVLAALVLGGRGQYWSDCLERICGGRYYLSLMLFFLFVWLLLRAVTLPFDLLGGYVVQHRWGFSTQSLASWWVDYVKGAGLDLLLSGLGVLLLFWATGRWPRTWWVVAGMFVAGWMVLSTFLWPVIVAPLFNRFYAVTTGPVPEMVSRLAARAGLKVDEVLVMDASRRTTKANAYYAGLGLTRRIVLYDNLLDNYAPREIEAVVAHEMAHWQRGHIWKGIGWGAAGSFLSLMLLYIFLQLLYPAGLRQGPYPPAVFLIMLLFFLAASLLTQPLANSLSRSYEAEADRVAVELTADPRAAADLQINLARRNLADVSPPLFIEWFSYSHPSTLRRIKAILEAKPIGR